MSITETEKYAIAQNLLDGFDIYDISLPGLNLVLTPFRTLRHEKGPNVRLSSLIIHGGRALAGASALGVVRVWNMKTWKKHFSLKHEGKQVFYEQI